MKIEIAILSALVIAITALISGGVGFVYAIQNIPKPVINTEPQTCIVKMLSREKRETHTVYGELGDIKNYR
jgi:hypothetical protein